MYLNKFKEDIEKIKNKKVIIAFSGGSDSVLLFYLVKKYAKVKSLELAYLNHNLRKDSPEEEEFILNFAKTENTFLYKRSLKIIEISKIRKKGIEETSREERYKFLKEVAGSSKLVLLAHHIDDNIETFLFRFLRGTSLKGLASIPHQRDIFIRPLLRSFYKIEILNYLNKKNIKYYQDESNHSNQYTRNNIRNNLIPILSSYNKNFKNSIYNLIEEVCKIPNFWLKRDVLKISELKKLDVYYRDNIIENFLKDRNLFTTNKLKNITDILNEKGTLTQDLGKNKILIKRYDSITIESLKYSKYEEISLELDKLTIFKNYTIKMTVSNKSESNFDDVYFFNFEEKDLLNIKLRTRLPGDIFSFKSEKSNKKLKEYFINEKISKDIRDDFILVALDSNIVSILGRKNSKKYESTEDLSNVKIYFKKNWTF